jgi:DNA-binding CsgD family transcriptional regulator
MQSAKLKSPQLPSEFYPDDLLVIKDVKFTPRQIDIIACLISGGTGKTISSLLGIEVKTLEAHKKSIGERIGGGIQEDIIKFIETSDKYELIGQHYSRLRDKNRFEKHLKELAKKIPENFAIFKIESQQISNKFSLLNLLIDHLKLAGIKLVSDDNDIEIGKQNFSTFTILSKDTTPSNLDQKISLLLDKEIHLNVLEDICKNGSNYIDFREAKNYFSSCANVLKKVYQDVKLENILIIIESENSKFENSSIDFSNAQGNPIELRKQSGKILERFSNNIRSDLIIPPALVIINRDELIDKLESSFKGQTPLQTAALVGIGGSGKTTLARQYAHLQDVAVIWEFNAETKECLLTGFESLAISLCNTQEEKKMVEGYQCLDSLFLKLDKITSFIKERLSKKENWILIYDNVEKFMDIQKYFPLDPKTWGKGRVIITTRDANIRHNKYINYTILVGELNPSEKLKLFANITTQGHPELFLDPQKTSVGEFLNFIPSFPLDVSIAAYYLNMTGITNEKYLDHLKQNQKEFIIAQENILNQNDAYTTTRYNIIVLSLKNLIDDNEDFRDLLLLICLLDSQYIPRALLNNYKDELIVDNFIYCFKKHSIITICSEHCLENECLSISTLSIHRSTQEISLNYLLKELSEEDKVQLLQSLTSVFAKYTNITLTQYINNPNLSETSWMQLIVCHCNAILKQKILLNEQSKSYIKATLGILYFS